MRQVPSSAGAQSNQEKTGQTKDDVAALGIKKAGDPFAYEQSNCGERRQNVSSQF